MGNKNTENDLIRRGDVLELLYEIKTDRGWPKNYGTLLTIIDQVWNMPVAYNQDEIIKQLECKSQEPRYQHNDEDYFTGIIEALEIVKEGGLT